MDSDYKKRRPKVSSTTGSGSEGWTAYAVATAGGSLCATIYTLYLGRRGRLFLRDGAAIAKNRAAIARVRSFWPVLAGGAVLVLGVATGSLAAVLFGVSGGALLGFWPGLVADFQRLRQEKWAKMTSGDEDA